MKVIKMILKMLKPNAYTSARPKWKKVEEGLCRMKKDEVSALAVLMVGKSAKKKGDKGL